MSFQAMTLALVFSMMLLQTSCVTRKTLVEQVVVHDTLREFHTDTVRLATHHSKSDTVRECQVQVVTLRQDSTRTDTVRVETLHERWHTVYVTDTTSVSRHLVDSLQSVFERQSVKQLSTSRRHTMEMMGRWFFIVLLVGLAILVFRMVASSND